jgi:hypothetical protein
VIGSAAYRQFYMHGTGHWLGRDVHDVGDYLSAGEAACEQPDGYGGTVVKKPSRLLQPGMAVTIEPGIYVRPAEACPEAYWNIGIRIEDGRHRHPRRMRADLARRAGDGRRHRGADAQVIGRAPHPCGGDDRATETLRSPCPRRRSPPHAARRPWRTCRDRAYAVHYASSKIE